MWPRIVEFMLGLWLVLGPLIFRLEASDPALIVNHLVYGTATVVAALIAVGVLVCALGLIPTDCLQPTQSWREYYANERRA